MNLCVCSVPTSVVGKLFGCVDIDIECKNISTSADIRVQCSLCAISRVCTHSGASCRKTNSHNASVLSLPGETLKTD